MAYWKAGFPSTHRVGCQDGVQGRKGELASGRFTCGDRSAVELVRVSHNIFLGRLGLNQAGEHVP